MLHSTSAMTDSISSLHTRLVAINGCVDGINGNFGSACDCRNGGRCVTGAPPPYWLWKTPIDFTASWTQPLLQCSPAELRRCDKPEGSVMKDPARPLALVTGASSGIGAHLARELAKDGHDLILVARRIAPLRALAEEVKVAGANTTVLVADLSKPGAAAELVGELQRRELVVDVLVNAAGLGDSGRFDETNTVRLAEMLHVNVVALTELTRLLLPAMVTRRCGRILLVASTGAFQPGPQMAAYCATKAYVLSFGEAITYELKDTGVTVTTLCPGATATEFARGARIEDAPLFSGSVHVMSAEDVAHLGYEGLKAGRRVVIAGMMNTLMAMSARVAPHSLSMAIGEYLMSHHVPPAAR
jgi:uncharacterized protein